MQRPPPEAGTLTGAGRLINQAPAPEPNKTLKPLIYLRRITSSATRLRWLGGAIMIGPERRAERLSSGQPARWRTGQTRCRGAGQVKCRVAGQTRYRGADQVKCCGAGPGQIPW